MKAIRVLLIEDNEDDAILTMHNLKENGYEPFYKRVFSYETLKALLTNESWDCVISDYAMPNFTGLDALEEFRKHNLEIPFILLSGTIGETLAVTAIKSGANDYIMKDHIALLGPALDRELREVETRRQNKQQDVQIREKEKLLEEKNIEIEIQNEELKQINEALKSSLHDLQESEMKFQAITNVSLDGICLIDLDGNFVLVNPMFCNITGFSSMELLKMKVNNLYSPSLLTHFLRNKDNKLGNYIETIIIRKDGTEVQVEVIGNSIFIYRRQLVVGTIRDITERKRIKKALYESERFSRATLDALSSSIAVLNEHGDIIFENKAWHDFGRDNLLLPLEKMEGYNYLSICDIVPADSNDYQFARLTADGIRKVIRGEIQTFNLEYPCDSPTIKRWFNLRVRRFEGDGTVFVAISHQDISERKIAEEELQSLNRTLEKKVNDRTAELARINKELISEINERKQANERFQLLVNSVPNSILLVDSNGLIQFANPQTENYFGYKVEELIGQKIEIFIPKESTFDHVSLRSKYMVEPVARSMKAFSIVYGVRKDGSKIAVEVGLNPIKINNEMFVLTSILDITESRKTEEELKQSATRLELAIRAGEVGIWDYDIKSNKLVWDNQMYALYDIEQSEFIGCYENWQACIYPDDREHFNAEVQSAIRGEKEFNSEFRVVWKDGSIHHIRAIAKVKKDNFGNTYRMIGTNWDITDRIQMEMKLTTAKAAAETANNRKSEFLANMSHEIRTPLNAIVGFTTILQEKTEGNKIFTEYLGNVIQSSKVLLNLISDILDLSKVEAGRMIVTHNPVNIHSLIKEILSIFAMKASEKGITLTTSISKDLPSSLITDEKYIRQIFFNLIGNAVKFTQIGNVEIEVSMISKGRESSKIDFLISIKDSGIGIPESEMQNIFEPFRQMARQNRNKYGGTGLGLSITRRLVELLNGTISVESVLGKGSVFCVSLFDIEIGALKTEEEIINGRDWLKRIRFNNPTVLLAEDVLSNRQVIKLYLEPFNITLIEVENGEDCINLARKQLPDLILMDMQMPVMDGYIATSLLKADSDLKKIPIIALTASGIGEEKDRYAEIADSFLLKPVYKYDLLELLIKYLPYELNAEIKNINILIKPIQTSLNTKDPLSVKTKTELRLKFLPIVTNLQQTLNFDNLIAFEKDLNKFSVEQDLTQIKEYCSDLRDCIATFNTEKIYTILMELSIFMKKEETWNF